MADVFLSYARTERAIAEPIKDRLEALGLTVFFDVEGLDGGDLFPDVLDQEVKSAGAVVSCWSPHALTRPWVKAECRIGMARDVLVPVAIKPLGVMDVPVEFSGVNYVDLTALNDNPDDENWSLLVRSLANTLNRPDLLRQELRAREHSPSVEDAMRAEMDELRRQMEDMRRANSPHEERKLDDPRPATSRKRFMIPVIAAMVVVGAAIGFGLSELAGRGDDIVEPGKELLETGTDPALESPSNDGDEMVNSNADTSLDLPVEPTPSKDDIAAAKDKAAYEKAVKSGQLADYQDYNRNSAFTIYRSEVRSLVDQHREAVRRLQAALRAKGFNPGGYDGIAGRGTRSAVLKFREAVNYTIDTPDLDGIEIASIEAFSTRVERWVKPEPEPTYPVGESFTDCTGLS